MFGGSCPAFSPAFPNLFPPIPNSPNHCVLPAASLLIAASASSAHYLEIELGDFVASLDTYTCLSRSLSLSLTLCIYVATHPYHCAHIYIYYIYDLDVLPDLLFRCSFL